MMISVFANIPGFPIVFKTPIWPIATKRNGFGVLAMILGGILLTKPCHAFQGYNVVVTTDPISQAAFLANTTNEFIATEVPNPFVANTYQINLYGINPNYNPPITNQELFAGLLYVDTSTYVYGWAAGESYQQTAQIDQTAYLESLCSSATNFTLVQTTTATFDTNTCLDTLSTVVEQLYQLSLSTPTQVQ